MTSVNEFRGLREFYARKCVAVLSRRFPAGGEEGWSVVIECVKRQPYGPQADALKLYQEQMADFSEWSAVDRFLFHADKVWEAESDALMNSPYARRHHCAA